MRRLILAVLLGVFIGVVGFCLFAFFSLKTQVMHEDAVFVVQRGTPMIMIAGQLSRAGVIKNPAIFSLYARAFHFDRRIKAGEYEFAGGLSAIEVLNKMIKGECRLYKITLIEGWTVNQMADYLAQQRFALPAFQSNFLAAANDKYFVRSLGIENDTAEGYLFPDTYMIQRPQTAEVLVNMLISEFNKVYTKEFEQRANELGFAKNQVVTLASIIEKEAGSNAERPIISSVFHNRLKKQMPLQADPTVIYTIKNFNGNIKKSDLSISSPYNTYVNQGLPPGPIANPGEASLKAALWPAQTDYLYFVARGDGTHEFNKTYPEHAKAVARYQLKK